MSLFLYLRVKTNFIWVHSFLPITVVFEMGLSVAQNGFNGAVILLQPFSPTQSGSFANFLELISYLCLSCQKPLGKNHPCAHLHPAGLPAPAPAQGLAAGKPGKSDAHFV